MNLRYRLCPQMVEYDRIGVQNHPYVMFTSTPNYSGGVLNTDRFGFRKTNFKNYSYSVENLNRISDCSLIVGGSTVFGVGSTSDGNTISSLMSKEKNHLFLNFGGRAYNSTQELILFTRFFSLLPPIKKVIIFSGLNNLYLTKLDEPTFPPFFFSEIFHEAMQNALLGKKRGFLKALLKPFFGSKIDYANISAKNLFELDLKKSMVYEDSQKNTQLDPLKALNVFSQDLKIWKYLSESMGFELKFVLQPNPSWGQKKLSDEEIELFAFLDKKNNVFQDLKLLGSQEIYRGYQSGLKKICENLNVQFYDSNIVLGESHEWLFIDRAHLTDLGNQLVVQDILFSIV
jgi:hypothetical protein